MKVYILSKKVIFKATNDKFTTKYKNNALMDFFLTMNNQASLPVRQTGNTLSLAVTVRGVDL
jgi:hypothetical protein